MPSWLARGRVKLLENKDISFEDALKRIEEIVAILEKGECSLDESLTLFEEATALCAQCNLKLEKAHQKIDNFTMISVKNED